MKFKLFFFTLIFAMGSCFTMQSLARQGITVWRKSLLSADLVPSKTVTRVEINQIELQPGQAIGLHLHPSPVVGYIVKGSVLFQIEGEKAKLLKTGDAFYEPANIKIAHFDNVSKTETMTFLAFYLLGKNEQELIRIL